MKRAACVFALAGFGVMGMVAWAMAADPLAPTNPAAAMPYCLVSSINSSGATSYTLAPSTPESLAAANILDRRAVIAAESRRYCAEHFPDGVMPPKHDWRTGQPVTQGVTTPESVMVNTTNGPVPGGVGYGLWYNDNALLWTNYTIVDYYVIAPTSIGQSIYYLYLTSTSRTKKGTESLVAYSGSNQMQFSIFDWSQTTNHWQVIINLPVDNPQYLTMRPDEFAISRQMVHVRNATYNLGFTNGLWQWENLTMLFDFSRGGWDFIYSKDYTTTNLSDNIHVVGQGSDWGPIIETFNSYTNINPVGFDLIRLFQDGNVNWLSPSNSSVQQDGTQSGVSSSTNWQLLATSSNTAYVAAISTNNLVSSQQTNFGSVCVTLNNNAGSFWLTSSTGLVSSGWVITPWNNGWDETVVGLKPGGYTINFNPVAQMSTPTQQVFTISSNVVSTIRANYGASTNFTNIVVGLVGVSNSAVAWGDYDNDGRLDLLLAGDTGTGYITRIYRNAGSGTFTNINAGLPGVCNGSVAWGDYDNDGNLDLLIAGDTGNGYITIIYRNSGGMFTNINAGLPGVCNGSVAWGDYDNDGRLDVLLAGSTGSSSISKIYHNNGNGMFADGQAGLAAVSYSSAAWGDYDKDGYLDILLTGFTGSNRISKIYRNNKDGTFSDIVANIAGIANGGAAWGDYDNDGDLDIVMAGQGTEDGFYLAKVYRNDNGVFTDMNVGLTPVRDSSVAWGDYDNDGKLDVLLAGNAGDGYGYITSIYHNNGSGTFSDIGAGLTGVFNGEVAWGDYDNDGKLDILATGNRTSKLYRSVTTTVNTAPTTPSGLSATVGTKGVTVSWNAATDSQTATTGLTYNVRIGSTAGGADILAPMANTTNGWRRLPVRGNVQRGLSIMLANLTPSKTYYWSVQAVDSALAGGAFATESSFATLSAPTAPSNLVSAADSQSQITLWWNDTSTNETGFRIERSATGINGWLQVGTVGPNVTSYSNTGLVANALWYYRVCAMGVNGDSFYTSVANAHAAHYETSGGTPVWRGLLLIYTNTDVTINGTNYAFTMAPERLNEGLKSFRWGMGRLHEHSLHRGMMVYDIVYVPHPVTSVSPSGSGYWLAPEDISGDINAYAPRGSYDSIFTYWEKGTLSGGGAWGLSFMGTTPAANGATYSMVNTLDVPSAWNKCDVYWHEWLHAGEGFYESRGYPQPSGGPDGAGGHGYSSDPQEGWGLYYRDIELCKVWETDAYTGIPQQGWFGGGPCDNRMHVQSDNFYMDTSTRYQKTGTIAWQSDSEFMALGTAAPADNSMYTTLTVTGVPTIVASAIMYVPGSGVGTGDVVALALRNATNTWWGQIEYGTNITKQFRLVRDGIAQASYVTPVTSGWYTVKLNVDLNADTIGMKAWGDGTQEPSAPQLSAALTSVWSPTQIGFRHFGQGIQVDDLLVTTPAPPARFTNMAVNLPGIDLGVVRWGDYDNDGDLDILIVGGTDTGRVSAIYRNDGGSFTNIGAALLPALSDADAQWGDFNNDGYLDILMAGNSGSSRVSCILRNNGDGTFTNINAGLAGVDLARVAWGDYDNDGKLDALISGFDGYARITKIYHNNGDGTFTDINAALAGTERGVAKWGDYDNDGYLDLLLAGYDGWNYATHIYHNNRNGTFTDINAGLHGLGYAAGAWGDYNNDGLLDLAISGFDGSGRLTRIYRNDGGGVFTDINANIPAVSDSDIAWGDYDNDGDLDLLYAGYPIGTYLCRNDGSNTFLAINVAFAGVRNCSVAWGDYDSDGKLDALISGFNGANRVAALYRNTDASAVPNTPPTAPAGLSAAAVDLANVKLSWNAATDGQTPANGLTYNLRIGTTSGGSDVVGPMANTTNGWRRVPALGSVNQVTNWTINGLSSGATYYWSVQAVDSALAGGSFAAQGAFTSPVPPVVTTDPISNLTANSAQCGGNLTVAGIPAATAKGLVWNTTGHPAVTNYLGKTDHGAAVGGFSDTMGSLTTGQIYYARAYASNGLGVAYGTERVFSPPMTAPGNALAFDGTNGYVTIADCAALDMTNNYTLECWFKADTLGSSGTLRGLIDKYQTANSYLLRLNGTDLDIDQMVTTGLGLQPGKWYHAAAINSNGTRRLYVNGELRALSGTTFTVQANNDPLRLGSDYGGRYFDGQMDEVRIWNVIRSEADIRDSMHHVLEGSETGLVAYYRFDQINGTALVDVSGNGHDGTAVNGLVWTNSTFPCATAITNCANLRGAWAAKTASLASDRFSVSNAVMTGTDFAVFGHDGATEGQTNSTDVPWNVDWRLERAWRTELSGGVNGSIRLDTTGLTDVGDGSRLCVLADADGTFTNAAEIGGTFSSPIFTVASQALASNAFYTLAKLGAFPGVTTAPITNITLTNAISGGEVTNQGASAVTARGVCWNTSGNPTPADSHTVDGSGPGAFISVLTNLVSGQTYYVRAYAVNGSGTGYGQQLSFLVPMTASGNALDFDGVNDYVQIADANKLDLTANYTLECWFKADGLGSLRGLIDKYQTGGASGYLLRLNGSELDFDQLVTSGLNLQAGRWYHAAAVNSNGTRTLYVNGLARTIAGTAINVQANSDPLRLGSDFGGRYFDGQLDEVRIWSSARSEGEIRDNMHKVLNGDETNLVAYYRFDHTAGVALKDLTTNDFAGALVNGPVWTNSTIPCANLIVSRANLRGAWLGQADSLACSILSVTGAAVTGTDFRVFGHDGGALTNNTTDKPALCGWRLNRAWRMEGTGALTGGIVFDCAGITNLVQSTSRLILLTDADGVFSNASLVGGSYNSGPQLLTISGQSLSNGFFYTLAEGDWPGVTTAPVGNVASNSARCGGNVTTEGGAPVTARGCVWNTNGNPTVESHEGMTSDGSGPGSFMSQLTGLAVARTYYVRAYAVSSLGTGYGAERAFTSAMIPPGNALAFDGVNDSVSLPAALATTVGGKDAITIEYWFKGSQLQSPVRFQDGGGYIVAGWSANGPKHVISTDGGTDNGVSVGAEATVENGQWHHLAMTWQRNTANGFKSYLDGALVAQRNSADVALPSLSSATPYLGCYGGSSEFLAGCLDEVRVWNVARTVDDIRDQMHKELNGTETGLVAYYRLNLFAATTAIDATTNGWDGTLLNGPVWTNSTMPCAAVIADRSQVRGVWVAKTNSLASGRLALTNGVVTGTGFAIFGHDNATESQNSSDKPAAADWRLNRAWRVEQTGAVTADLQFDITGFSGPFALLVDADGVFSNSALLSGPTDNGTFTVPDVSLGNGYYYTLGRVDAPLLTTAPISNITWTTAVGGGNVTNQGGSAVTARGCVWNRTGNPTVDSRDGLTTDGSGLGVFSSSLTGLVAECTYSVRAYAVNARGTAYGAERTFATLRALAQVTTDPVSNMTYSSAQCGGNVTNEGQTAVTARGVCWNTSPSPTIANSHTTDGSGPGTFSSAITGIVERQVYYVRAYASNTQGVAYGGERSFTAPMIVPGNCLDFDGINQKVASFGDIGPIPTNDVTVEAWVQLDDVTRDGKIVSRPSGSPGYEGYILGTRNGMLYPEAWDTAGTRYTFQAGVVIAGRWTHLAIVYQRNNALIGYVNGVEVGRTNVANLALRVHSQNGVNIGVGPGSFANYTDGRIDEVRVWHIARTEEQIRDDMHHALTGSESGLSACYNFDQVSGSTLPDLTSNGSTYAYLNNMYDGNWWRSGWPCAHIIGDWNNLRGVWIDRTNSLASSIMSIAQTNVTGTAFALVGHDGGPLARNFTDSPAPLYWRLNRCWRTEDGGVSNGTVRFDTTAISALVSDPALLRLLVDRDGVFVDATVLAGSYTDGVFSVTGQPLTNGVFYTLGGLADFAEVTTAPISNVTYNAANGGGEVTLSGLGSVIARGVCWNTSSNPTVSDAHTTDGSGLGAFVSSVTGLQFSTTYFVRAYAVNDSGAAYGDEQCFTTRTALAYVTTDPVSNVTHNVAQSGGNVTNEGVYAVTARGVCWSLAGSPTTNDAHTTDGSGPGAFVSQLTGLSGLQTYHVRAYAINSAGVSYGNEQTFATLIAPPGNALDFNNNSIATGSGLFTNFANRMTLECWVYHDELTNRTSRYVTVEPEMAVIRHDSGNNGRLHTYFKLNGTLRGLSVDNVLQTGRWYHVAGVWDSTNINLYLNGVLLTNANYAGQVLATNSGGITLGSSGEYLNGRLDEVRVWNAGRTQTEIRDAMHKQLSGTESGLAAYYPCNEGSGSIAHDMVGGANIASMANIGWASSTFPCANVIADRTNLRGAWAPQTNSWSSSILSVSNAVVGGTDFRVFGHDNGTLTNNTTDKTAAYAWRLNRAWQVEGTGALTGTVVFDCSGLGGIITNTAYLRMLMDADGVFTNATVVTGAYTNTTQTFTVPRQTLSNGWFYTLAEGGWPTLSTYPVSNITHSAAQGGGNVTASAASAVTERGVCWNTSGSPTIADSHSSAGGGTGGFVSGLTALSPQTLYYVRAYAVNTQGTGYGDERTFTTLVAPPGSALDFDGTNDYVAIPDHNQLDMTSNYTLECWFKADNLGVAGTLRGLIDKYQTSGAAGYFLRLNGTELDFDQLVTSGLNLQSNRWYHAAAVNSNGTRTLYVNGLARMIAGTATIVQTNANEVRLGCDYSTRFYDGQMDEVRIWNVVRSEAEIRDGMHRQLGGGEPGLVAYYNFNMSSSTILPDLTTNAHNGALTNGPAWVNSTVPCANLIAGTNNLRGAWITQTNSLACSILSMSNSAVTGLSFRVFGHDGGVLTSNTLDMPPSCAWRLNRAWQVEGTGSLTGTLVFDCSGITNLIGNSTRLRLLVDSDSTFANATPVAGNYAANAFAIAGQAVPANGYYTLGEQAMRAIVATAGLHGAINPSGTVWVLHGGVTNFVITPATYWHVGDVTTNSASIGAVTAFTWSNVVADGTINATFAENLAAQGTPHWWLAQYGLTNGGWTFNQAETNRSDSDPLNNGQEYVADTDPTNAASYFRAMAVSNLPPWTVYFLSSTGRMYTLTASSNLVNGVWTNVPGAGSRIGLGGFDSMPDTNVPPKGTFYRLKVELP